ncbi:Uncharacterised protein [Actinomyces bovis]|uniref:DUF4913 domain-containing protein n=1 Tax=Actinomyces bovis TaxID=1658 RepID=A0ABY1VMY5_9ACTO|nr:DUF4913 domain-containing protein [Actinomyces bovis]SPT53474.1 Uncharacterised protein [Actinomyces bovis]VEG55349.1 Uncharacterised protein [Actinomyces israelii]
MSEPNPFVSDPGRSASSSVPLDDGGQPQAVPFQFPTLNDFVTGLIALIYERATSTATTWCPKWWMHDEAVLRLTALWQAWEEMHVNEQPLATAKWLVYYADPIMGQLLSSEGTFKGCSVERGHQPRRPHPEAMLPCEPPPDDLFTPRM